VLIVGGVAVLLILTITGSFLFFRDRSENPASSESNPVAVAPPTTPEVATNGTGSESGGMASATAPGPAADSSPLANTQQPATAVATANAVQGSPAAGSPPPSQTAVSPPVRVENQNPAAYTKKGGRRTDDPEPRKMHATARGTGTVQVVIEGPPELDLVRDYVVSRLKEIVDAKQFRTQYSGGKLTVTLDGIADTAALAECIDFGDVRSTTPEMIQVVASLAKLPVPPPPLPQDDNNFGLPAGLFPINPAANAAPLDAAAIANLIANLTHWDPQKRGIAVALLGRALPGLSPDQAQLVTAALEIRKDDVDTSVKVSADLLLKNSVVMSSPKTDVARVLITGVTETKAQLALTGQLRSLSGSKNVSAKSENGLLTVELENIKDVEALAKTIRFGMVTKVDAGAREIHVTVSGN
jgi:hypothetical protein